MSKPATYTVTHDNGQVSTHHSTKTIHYAVECAIPMDLAIHIAEEHVALTSGYSPRAVTRAKNELARRRAATGPTFYAVESWHTTRALADKAARADTDKAAGRSRWVVADYMQAFIYRVVPVD